MGEDSKVKKHGKLKRIAITGPESTGKSWLAEALAIHYNTLWVPEYAREYLMRLGRAYRYEDILFISKAQYEMECLYAKRSDHILFCDTDFLVTKIWSEVKFGECHPWINNMLETHHYTHHFLCSIDLPWEDDPLREHPHLREELYNRYLHELRVRRLPFSVISGLGQDRVDKAIQIINALCQA